MKTLEENLKKKIEVLNFMIKDTKDPYQRGYSVGQKHLCQKLLELIKNGGI